MAAEIAALLPLWLKPFIAPTLPMLWKLLIAALIFGVLEQLIAAEPNQPWRNRAYDLAASAFFIAVTPMMSAITGAATVQLLAKSTGSVFSLDLASISIGYAWIDQLLKHLMFPLIPILVADFGYYWFHRLQHTVPFLWEQHKFHHTSESVSVTTSSRHHILEYPFRTFITIAPLGLLLNISPVQGALIGIFTAYWGFFIHANIRLHLGRLALVFAGPQYHRIHHSIELRHRDKNYSAFFPFWDWLFGTYYHPQPTEYPKTGVEGEGHGRWHDVVTLPFIGWWRMLNRALNRRRSIKHLTPGE